jgi:hypothetical protein
MTTLRAAVRAYLAMRRDLGFHLRESGRLLLQFVAFMEQHRARPANDRYRERRNVRPAVTYALPKHKTGLTAHRDQAREHWSGWPDSNRRPPDPQGVFDAFSSDATGLQGVSKAFQFNDLPSYEVNRRVSRNVSEYRRFVTHVLPTQPLHSPGPPCDFWSRRDEN